MKKSIKELAWNVSEEVYRADEAISYSTLSMYAREGQKAIPHLKDKKDTESLRFGSIVDCLLTEPDTLEDRFFIADFPKVSDKIILICKTIFERTDGLYRTLDSIESSKLLAVIKEFDYYSNWGDSSRIKDVISKGNEYYKLLFISNSKTIISSEDYERAQNCVEILRTNPFTYKYFSVEPFKDVEKEYQLRFRSTSLHVRAVRCMFDLIIVDHENKTIQPIDLKTSGKDEENFEDSFIQWRYMIQATLYAQILEDAILKDDYFRSFEILPYKFIVINKFNQTPLIWTFPDTMWENDFITTDGQILKGWRTLLTELNWFLKTQQFSYSYESYQSKGERIITKIKPYESN